MHALCLPPYLSSYVIIILFCPHPSSGFVESTRIQQPLPIKIRIFHLIFSHVSYENIEDVQSNLGAPDACNVSKIIEDDSSQKQQTNPSTPQPTADATLSFTDDVRRGPVLAITSPTPSHSRRHSMFDRSDIRHPLIFLETDHILGEVRSLTRRQGHAHVDLRTKKARGLTTHDTSVQIV